MISAASARASIASRSGAIGAGSAVDVESPPQQDHVASATDVRELVSIAMVRMSFGSRRV